MFTLKIEADVIAQEYLQKQIKLNLKLMNILLAVIGVFAMLCGLTVHAQNGVNSPYSQFGIGVTDMPYNSPHTIGGGAYLATSGHNIVNVYNPATYGGIMSRSFVFDVGLGVQLNWLRDNTNKEFDADGYLSHISIAFPFCKWWKTAFSVQPFSKVEYDFAILSEDTATYGKMNTEYSGEGGVNRFTWGHAFNIGERVSVGFNLHLLYGNLAHYITCDFFANDTSWYIDNQSQKKTRILNFGTDVGIRYYQPIGEKYTLSVGAIMRPAIRQTVKESAYKYTVANGSSREVVYPREGESGEYRSHVSESWSAGLGLSFCRNDRWLVSFDWQWAAWNGLKLDDGAEVKILSESVVDYRPYNRVALGFSWIGNSQGTHYWERVGYSLGLHYEMNKFNTVTCGIDEYGLGVGVTLPMRKGRSAIHLAAGYNRFGKSELLVRDCLSIGISFGSCESWFVKRKYN